VYALLRLAAAVPTLLGVSLVTFLLVHLAPGDPLATLTQGLAPESVMAALRAYYGFDQPLPVQYLRWLGQVAQGEFGVSIATGQAITPALGAALANTLKILLPAALLAVSLGWLLGSAAALSPPGFAGLFSGVFIACVSVPSYWLGLVLIAGFAVSLNWLPVMGMGPGATLGGLLSAQGLAHLVLPAITLAVTPAGILARSTKATIETVAAQDFVEALRARGLPPGEIRGAIRRNAMPTLVALYGLQVAYLFGAVILIETVFAWPGIGTFLANAIQQRDLPSIQAALLVTASAFVIVNLVADMLQVLLDPRVRR
jgi:peptide/nickel transport system permease protein